MLVGLDRDRALRDDDVPARSPVLLSSLTVAVVAVELDRLARGPPFPRARARAGQRKATAGQRRENGQRHDGVRVIAPDAPAAVVCRCTPELSLMRLGACCRASSPDRSDYSTRFLDRHRLVGARVLPCGIVGIRSSA